MPVLEHLKLLVRNCDGATAVEYGLILALVFLAMVGAVQGVGNSTIGMWNTISTTSASAIAQSAI